MGFYSGICILTVLMAFFIFQSDAQEKNYTVPEELPENVLIGDLVKDLNLTFSPDKKLSTPLQFKLVYKSGDLPIVKIEETTGEIYTTGVRIDREELCTGIYIETHCFYEVEVAVLPDEIFKLVKIRFIIEDVNDNAPLFPATVINISIPENTAINSRYPIPSAIDPDIGINGIQQYELIKSVVPGFNVGTNITKYLEELDIFGLDVIETPEGEKWPQLIVQKMLDREERDTYVMKLKVEDGGSPPRSSTAILQVSVIDMNDNRPIFKETEIEVTIPENAPVGSSVYQLHATDADVGANARIQYFFSSLMSNVAKKLFSLNNTTGLITIKEPLDREQAPLHKLMIVATDGGPMPARAMVIVNVTDVNDNLPLIDVRYIIDTTNGTVFLSENAALNTKIALVTLIDKDADRNGRVTCFTTNEVPFRLRPVFDNQFLMETSSFLDYETVKEYEVQLLASDAGKPPLNYTTSVVIKIKDENDNAPVFTQPTFGISVPENNALGAQLTKISATDKDSGKNGEITYLIANEGPYPFSLDNRTGVLSAVEQLDRETKDKYTFTVTARDNGEPHLQSNATVTVTVLDQNDNSPTFTHSEYNFYVPENLPKHGTVGLITITDPDTGDNGVITLTILNNNGSFIIDAVNGVIRPNISFDREKQESYTFVVVATDGGRVPRSSTARVTINVVDINDNKPVFVVPPSNYTFEFIPLATEIGTLLYVVMAVDEDTGMNSEIRYQIEDGNKKKLFEMEGSSGNITLKSKFIPADTGLHKLLIKARDLGQPDSMNSKILVNLFVNDSLHNSSFVDELLRRARGKTRNREVEKTDVANTINSDYIKYIIAIISGSMTAVLTIVIAAILRCRHFPGFKARKQNSEWVTPNPANSETITLTTTDIGGANSVIVNLVSLSEPRTDDAENEEEVTTSIDVAVDIEEATMEKYNWGTNSSTFKPDGPDLAQHYKATSPQPAFHIEPETPVHSKHHVIQELPLDNTFVMGCDSLSKCSSSSSDPYSISDCSCQGTIKTTATIHPRQAANELGMTDIPLNDPNVIAIRTYPLHLMPAARPRTPLREPAVQETVVDIWGPPQRKPEPKKPGKAQRRVTFHLPESSQESGSDNAPIDVEAGAVGGARPFGYGRRDYYDHATHSNRTEGDGNSDPETAAEVTVQPTLEEASDNCTQECFILGHSDSCWMPAALPQYQQPRSPEPPAVIRHSPPASNLITTTVLCHNPPQPQAAAICPSPPQAQRLELGHGARPEERGATGGLFAQDDSIQGRRSGPRGLFCTAEHDNSIKVIPMMTFPPGRARREFPKVDENPM